MKKYLGHVICSECGYRHIRQASQVTIWYAKDQKRQTATVVCDGCGNSIDSNIGLEDLIAFTQLGVTAKPLSDKFTPLTEAQIDEWDFAEFEQHLV